MSWTNELYRVYELACGVDYENSAPLLPLYHISKEVQIQVTVSEKGIFKNAEEVRDDEKDTIMPDTGKSQTGGSVNPYPLTEKLKVLAGDWNKYASGWINNTSFYDKYVLELARWKDSQFSHPAVEAIYRYIIQGSLYKDLISSGIIQPVEFNEKTGKAINQLGCSPDKIFIRFIVNYNDLYREARTWKDKSLYDSFIGFHQSNMDNAQVCYATGKILPVADIHPYGIVKTAAKAKIISANDKKGFTFRGRFKDKNEALSVSCDFSQKMHNALKWLIKKQGQHFGMLTLVTWASALQALPDETQNRNIEDEWEEEESYDSLPEYRAWLSRYLMGYKQKFQNNTKVMILGLDATSRDAGRLSISLYDELYGSDFLKNLEHWHNNSACLRFDQKREKNVVKSCSLYEIIRAACGTERNGKLECDDKLFRDSILKLLPCIMKRQHLPQNLIQALYHKASNPLSYDNQDNHRLVIEVICSMIRVKLNEKTGGVEFMAYDPNEKNRSYLYGCLLAVADKAEFERYDKEDRKNRVTNAKRYWSRFSQRPYQTWGIIEERLQPYLNQHPYKITIEERVQEITEKFTKKEFEDNSRLEPLYLLGYHHFMAYMDKNNPKEEN